MRVKIVGLKSGRGAAVFNGTLATVQEYHPEERQCWRVLSDVDGQVKALTPENLSTAGVEQTMLKRETETGGSGSGEG